MNMNASADFSNAIGLVRRLDGSWEPSNELSDQKCRALLAARGFDIPATLRFDDLELSVLRDQARQGGYRILTTRRTVQ